MVLDRRSRRGVFWQIEGDSPIFVERKLGQSPPLIGRNAHAPQDYRTFAVGRVIVPFLAVGRRARRRAAGQVAACAIWPRAAFPPRAKSAWSTDGSRRVAAGQQSGPAAQAWFDRWIGAALPFSFRYDGKDFTGTATPGSSTAAMSAAKANVETPGLELAARQDRTESDLARQAIPRLPGGRYPADV